VSLFYDRQTIATVSDSLALFPADKFNSAMYRIDTRRKQVLGVGA
jgi:hypothetical protein